MNYRRRQIKQRFVDTVSVILVTQPFPTFDRGQQQIAGALFEACFSGMYIMLK